MPANISIQDHPAERISNLLAQIGQPARLQILLVIDLREVCVRHLEMVLGLRQSTISQHLMALRQAGIVTARRNGRNIYYSLAKPEILDFLQYAARVTNIDPVVFDSLKVRPIRNCPCPLCSSEPNAIPTGSI
jgi:DNA-binding transcriptional ArsR family regulator